MAKYHVFRVEPDRELYGAVVEYADENSIDSGLVVGMIGSLKEVELAFIKTLPGNYIKRSFGGPLEIAAAQGNLAMDKTTGERIAHIHITVSNETQAVAGHLVSGRIYTTAEVALLEFTNGNEPNLERGEDPYTGLRELIN